MPMLIFLPGHLCDARVWEPVASRLRQCGYRTADATLDDDVDVDGMARRVLTEHAGPLIAIGFSMGAIVALALQRAAPERVAALCLANVNAGPDLPERAAVRHAQQDAARIGRLGEIVRDQLVPAYFAAHSPRTAELSNLCVDMAAVIGPEAFVRQSEALRLRPDARPGLAAITCPTLVIGAEEDRLCPPEWHRETAAAIPNAQLSIIAGGHMALLEHPGDMAAAIGAWLRQLEGAN